MASQQVNDHIGLPTEKGLERDVYGGDSRIHKAARGLEKLEVLWAAKPLDLLGPVY